MPRRKWSVLFPLFWVVGWGLYFPSAPPAGAQTASSPFAAVFVDDKTEAVWGPFPYDRSVYARAVTALQAAGARAVVVKYFLDIPKTDQGDDALAAGMRSLPVFLQARLDNSDKNANDLPISFSCDPQAAGDRTLLLSGESGWIPLKKFTDHCAGLGFVDLASQNEVFKVPMIVKYQGHLYPSLELAVLEFVFGEKAEIQIGNQVTLAGHHLPLDSMGRVLVEPPDAGLVQPISLLDIVQGRFDSARIKGKIVVLGFDAKETPELSTVQGPIRIHRIFYLSLEGLYNQFMLN